MSQKKAMMKGKKKKGKDLEAESKERLRLFRESGRVKNLLYSLETK